MALIVRVASVVLSWKRDGLSRWLLSSESLQLQLCFGGCGTARPLWQYFELRAPLWLMTLRYHTSLLLNGPFGVKLSATDIPLLGAGLKRAECNRKPFGSSQELKGFNYKKCKKHVPQLPSDLGNSNLEEGSSKKFE
eukprot:scaffold4678_cov85-Skeletonema_dohrnii-CCMP3373.AAC.1